MNTLELYILNMLADGPTSDFGDVTSCQGTLTELVKRELVSAKVREDHISYWITEKGRRSLQGELDHL